jgi:hypothetical protein
MVISPATFPALRTLNRLYSRTSKIVSGFTRASAHDRIAANGHWPFVGSLPGGV